MNTNTTNIADRLEYLRGEIEAERISLSEIAELQDLSEHIPQNDVTLLEWASVPEFKTCALCDASSPECGDICRACSDNISC